MKKGPWLSIVLVVVLTGLGVFLYRNGAVEAGSETARKSGSGRPRSSASTLGSASNKPGRAGQAGATGEAETFLQSLIRQGMIGLRGTGLVHFRALPPAELAAVLREIEAMKQTPLTLIMLADLHEAWAEKDPAGALESALQHGADSVRGTLAGWAKTSPLEAWNWVARPETKATSSLNELDSYYRTIVTTLGRRNEEIIAAELLDTLTPSMTRMSLAGDIAQTWAVKSPGELGLWLQRNEAKDKDAAAFAANFLGIILSQKGPEAILGAVNMQGELVGNSIIGAAVGQWAKAGQNDHLETLVRALPTLSNERADTVLAQVGAATAPRDPAEGLSLLLRVQNATERNRWLWNTANTLIATSPASAMDYVVAISDPVTRETRARRIHTQWAAKDPVAAQAKLESPGFPLALREALTGGK